MILPGRATGSAYFSPSSGRRADAGARFARSPSDVRSPLFAAQDLGEIARHLRIHRLQIDDLSPSTTPSRTPSFASNPTIFISLPP